MIAVLDPFGGLAGDMFLAALLDAGASLDSVRQAVASTGLKGWELSSERIVDHGLAATQVRVRITDTATERRAAELIALAQDAQPGAVARAAVATLQALAEVEARLHGVAVADVHLHELGGHDTLIDVVGVCAALDELGVDEIYCLPVPLGNGTVTTRHGVLPVPAPATAALLQGATVVGSDLPGEPVTPTAAALLATLGVRWDAPPAITLQGSGYGAGARRLADRPNVAAVRLGSLPAQVGNLIELATNVDDVSGEILGYVLDRLLEAGALDVWITPAVMKKSRPGHIVGVLARPEHEAVLRELLLRETGSLGVRSRRVLRYALDRETVTVEVQGHPIRVKRGPHGVKPEHEDVVAAARQLDVPLSEVARRAREEATTR